jgi:CheY-specific phosphatase CheX
MKFEFKPFIDALNRTFKEMVGEEPINGAPEEPDGKDIMADVSAHIGLMGPEKANVVLILTNNIAKQIVKTIMGIDPKDDDHQIVADTVGEILNMIIGSTQRHSPIKFEFSLPGVIIGNSHEVRLLSGGHYRKVISKLSGEDIGLYLVSES